MNIAKTLHSAIHHALLGALLATLAIAPAQSYSGSGAQPVTRGGTGKAALTQNNLIFGNGTAPVGFIAPGTNGRCLIDSGSAWTPGYCVTSSGAAATGTSGHAVPFLDGLNIFSQLQTISQNAGSLSAAQTGALIRAAQADGVATRAELDSFGAASFYSCVRADNTSAAPAALGANDEICSINSFGYNGAGAVGPAAALRSYAAEAWSSGHQGTYWRIATTPIGGTALTDRIGFENDGGITAPPSVTGGSKGAGTFNASLGYYVSGALLENIFALSGSFSLPGGTLTLQPASASALGGVNSIAQASHQFVSWIDTAGLPHLAQPGFGDLSGSLAPGQCPAGTIAALGCVEGDNATLALSSGLISINLGHANAWTGIQTFPNNSLTLAEFPTFAASTVLGSIAGGTPINLSQAQLTSLVNAFTTTSSGAVPAPGTSSGRLLGDDGTWHTVTGAGTVTSVGLTGTSGDVTISGSSSPITGAGTFNVDLSASRKTNPAGCAINSTTATTCADGSAGANNGTYTVPTGALWLEIEGIGGGGAGAGSGTSPGNGGTGSASTFGTGPLLSAAPGSGATAAAGGVGGTPSGGFMNKSGAAGGNGSGVNDTQGGFGCSSPYGGAGVGGAAGAGAGIAAAPNTGSGGGGGGVNVTPNGGGGGGCGGFVRAIIPGPLAASYPYAIGPGGTAGTAGTSGAAGGAGGSGAWQIIPHFNFLLKRDLDPACNDNSPMWLEVAA